VSLSRSLNCKWRWEPHNGPGNQTWPDKNTVMWVPALSSSSSVLDYFSPPGPTASLCRAICFLWVILSKHFHGLLLAGSYWQKKIENLIFRLRMHVRVCAHVHTHSCSMMYLCVFMCAHACKSVCTNVWQCQSSGLH
jgi:hypothetical protein